MPDETRQATWIWYPDDYEIWLHRKVSGLRQYRGHICPPLWRIDSPYTNVAFRKKIHLAEPERIELSVQGDFVVLLNDDHKPVSCERKPITAITLPAGEHEVVIHVYAEKELPAIYARGSTLWTDGSWEVTALNGKWVRAASWTFNDIRCPPAHFPFSHLKTQPVTVSEQNGAVVVDFGGETFGYVTLVGAGGRGSIYLYYGETLGEALAIDEAETFDKLSVGDDPADVTTSVARAFRYIQIKVDDGVFFREVRHLYEYVTVERRGAFHCSDMRLNEIWELSAHTLHLNMREFLFDGLKRDRWVWSGGASIGFLINNYAFFEQDVTKRTIVALRGKDPVETHINTIMDYTFYWILSLYDYYLYTGDIDFIAACYPKLLSLMAFCLNRTNESGMMEGYENDWVFIDWADIDLQGEVCAEQLLFCRSLETAAMFARLFGDLPNATRFQSLAADLKARVFELFWDEASGGLLHSRLRGELNRKLLKYPNVFAVRFGYLDGVRMKSVLDNVLMNDGVPKIKTPFMRFFELEALILLGQHDFVLDEIRDYWGGMIDLGATTFWEQYDPDIGVDEQFDMYGGKYRKSLCHAWGAAPIYLLGNYVLGVRPVGPGYAEYVVEPRLGDLIWIEGRVPTPHGDIAVYADKERIFVHTVAAGRGLLRFRSDAAPSANKGNLRPIGNGEYELEMLQPGFRYEVHFAAVLTK